MTIISENPGEADPRALTTLGVNVKEDEESAIGFFGTGFKFSVATILRHGERITLQVGTKEMAFETQRVEIRGKPFDIVTLDGQELGFTTELGKNWEMWMAYRELWANAKDEGGEVRSGRAPKPAEGLTRVLVDGPAFEKAHATRRDFILHTSPLEVVVRAGCEIHPGESGCVFYKGFKVYDLPLRSKYTYNIIGNVQLTEDRTLASYWEAQYHIGRAITGSQDTDYLRSVVSLPEDSYWEVGDDLVSTVGSAEFLEVVGERIKRKRGSVPHNLFRAYRKHAEPEAPNVLPLDEIESLRLARARAFIIKLGYPADEYTMLKTDSLGEGVYGAVIDRQIYLSVEAFNRGTTELATTMLEEIIHLHHDLLDCSRALQEHLLRLVMKLGERATGDIL